MDGSNKYSDSELYLMSYQELRRISILFRLPANIKKKYMISMIQAHQRGDYTEKSAIANQVLEERKTRKSKKGSKPLISTAGPSIQQVPTDLSITGKHEFEARYSYYTRYKENPGARISEVIKEEAVSRRNRSVLQQTRKSTRKLSAIMLPRNHSLTTPVRLMPQHEKNFQPTNVLSQATATPVAASVSSNSASTAVASSWGNDMYEPVSSPDSEDRFREAGACAFGPLPIAPDFGSIFTSSNAHESHKSQQYWHPREMYNGSTLVPGMSSLLTPNSTITSSSDLSPNSTKSQSFQQGIYEKYVRTNLEREFFESTNNNGSGDSDENAQNNNCTNCSCVNTRAENYQLNIQAKSNNPDEHCCGRDDTVIRHTNGNNYEGGTCLVDIFIPQGEDTSTNPQTRNDVNNLEASHHHNMGYIRLENPIQPFHLSQFHSSAESASRTGNLELSREEITWDKVDGDYQYMYSDDVTIRKSFNNENDNIHRSENETTGYEPMEKSDSFSTDLSDSSSCPHDLNVSEEREAPSQEISDVREDSDRESSVLSRSSRCRYSFGHNERPDVSSKPSCENEQLPSFLSVFSPIRQSRDGYSVCKNSFTGTTGAHVYPIMTSAYCQAINAANYQTMRNWSFSTSEGIDSQTDQEAAAQGSGIVHHYPRYVHSYPESRSSFTVDDNSWNEYNESLNNKLLVRNGAQQVQIVQCVRHGCHVYALSGSQQ